MRRDGDDELKAVTFPRHCCIDAILVFIMEMLKTISGLKGLRSVCLIMDLFQLISVQSPFKFN